MMKTSKIFFAVLAALLLAASLGGCSTTSRIGDGEILYTGVKKIDITPVEGEKVPSGLSSQITEAVKVKPNNSLLGSAGYRYPFPLGLWVYNHWDNPPKGLKHWLYEKLVEEPVLVSNVRPEVRAHMIDEILDNNGYFRGNATYELAQGKNKKKASIIYRVKTGAPNLLESI